MSRSYDIACVTCREYLWVGQGWPPDGGKEDRRYLYTDGRISSPLVAFLFKHISNGPDDKSRLHKLIFTDGEIMGIDAAFSESKWVDLCSKCGAAPPCEHEPAPDNQCAKCGGDLDDGFCAECYSNDQYADGELED